MKTIMKIFNVLKTIFQKGLSKNVNGANFFERIIQNF